MSAASEFPRFVQAVEPTGEVTINGVTVQVSREMVADAWDMQSVVNAAWDVWQHPWKRPDRIDWPEFVPLPRFAAFTASMQERRQRARDAWSVLLGRERVYDPDRDDDW